MSVQSYPISSLHAWALAGWLFHPLWGQGLTWEILGFPPATSLKWELPCFDNSIQFCLSVMGVKSQHYAITCCFVTCNCILETLTLTSTNHHMIVSFWDWTTFSILNTQVTCDCCKTGLHQWVHHNQATELNCSAVICCLWHPWELDYPWDIYRYLEISLLSWFGRMRRYILGKQNRSFASFRTLRYMTDGVLLRETLFEPDLDRYCAWWPGVS